MSTQPICEKAPAFAELSTSNGTLTVWVNRTLLPDLSDTLDKSFNHELKDFARACSEIYHGNRTACSNSACEITTDGFQSHEGARITFRSQIGPDAIRSLITTPNRAIAKIGYEWRAASGGNEEQTEIRWRGRRDYFLCGVNIPAQAATLTFNRSAILELVQLLPDHPIRATFEKLVGILDIDNEDADEALDNETAAAADSLMSVQFPRRT